MIKFIPTKNLTKEDRFQVALMTGKIVLWILNGRSLDSQ